MEKPKDIQSSAEIVISKITDKESVITVTRNNPLERGNDSGRDAGSMRGTLTTERLCSRHFVLGKSDNPENPDYNPSIFPTSHMKAKNQTDIERFNCRKRRHDQVSESQEH